MSVGLAQELRALMARNVLKTGRAEGKGFLGRAGGVRERKYQDYSGRRSHKGIKQATFQGEPATKRERERESDGDREENRENVRIGSEG